METRLGYFAMSEKPAIAPAAPTTSRCAREFRAAGLVSSSQILDGVAVPRLEALDAVEPARHRACRTSGGSMQTCCENISPV